MVALNPQEEKNRRIALAVSIVAHLVLLLFLFFMLVWKAENPPKDQIGGIEMSFGTTDAGSGEIHSKATPNESPNKEDSRPPAASEEVTPVPVVTPVVTPTPPVAEKIVTSSMESPVAVKEEPKPQPKPEPKVEEKKVDNRALLPVKSKDGGGNGTAGTSNTATGNNNGKEGVTGDKGNPAGLYPGSKSGAGGSGGGPLNMPGWRFDLEPKTDPFNNETGKVVFRIKIDAEGEITSLDIIESNVSAKVANFYRSEVRKSTFSRTSGAGSKSVGATGTITFLIRSR